MGFIVEMKKEYPDTTIVVSYLLNDKRRNEWTTRRSDAYIFGSLPEVMAVLDSLEKRRNTKYRVVKSEG